MKILISIISVVLIFLLPFPILSSDKSDPYTYFSMGYYYLYNNSLSMAKTQFKACLLMEKEPSSVIYSILAEISNMLSEKEDAIDYASKSLEINPEDKISLEIMTFILLEDGKYDKAITYIERLSKQEPENLHILYSLVNCYQHLKNDNGLIDTYNRMIRLNPDLIDIRLNLGYLYTRKGLFGLAIKEYKKVLKLKPNNEKAIFYLTYIYFSEGKTDEALKFFNKLDKRDLLNDEILQDYAADLFIEDQDPKPMIDRIKDKNKISTLTKAIIFYIDGKLDQAKKFFEEVVRTDENNIAACKGLIKIAVKKNNMDMEKKWRFILAGNYYNLSIYEKALDEAKRVKVIDPYFLENRYLLGDIFSALGLIQKTIDEYEFFKKNAKELGNVNIKLGISYDEINNHEEAIKNFIAAIALFPNNDRIYYYLGIEYRIIKDYEKAVNTFKKALEINQEDASYNLNLAISYERLGKVNEAIPYLEKSIRIEDSNAIALNYLGYILADKGIRLDEAMIYIEKALKIDPDNCAYLDSMGWLYYKSGDYKKAIDYLKQAIKNIDKTDEENYLIYDHLGDTYFKLSLIKKAIESWKEALKMKYIGEIKIKIKKAEEENCK